MEKSPVVRINLLHVLAYLFMEGGVAALTLFLAIEVPSYGPGGPALPLLFFAVVSGMIAFTFWLRERGIGWLLLAALPWGAAAALGLLWFSIEGWLHPALLLALMAFGAAGGVLYLAGRRKTDTQRPMLMERTRFDPLGAHHAAERELTPMERDHS